jgi:hypothetical protein
MLSQRIQQQHEHSTLDSADAAAGSGTAPRVLESLRIDVDSNVPPTTIKSSSSSSVDDFFGPLAM